MIKNLTTLRDLSVGNLTFKTQRNRFLSAQTKLLPSTLNRLRVIRFPAAILKQCKPVTCPEQCTVHPVIICACNRLAVPISLARLTS